MFSFSVSLTSSDGRTASDLLVHQRKVRINLILYLWIKPFFIPLAGKIEVEPSILSEYHVIYKAIFLSSVPKPMNISRLILIFSVNTLTWELIWVAWQQSEAQSAAAEQLSPYRAGLWQNKNSNEWMKMCTMWQRHMRRVSISAVQSCLQSCTLKFKIKLTANKIPNPVAFWVNHPKSPCPSLLSTLHLCSFILCWRAGGGLGCVVEGLGMTVVAFLPEQLPRSSWIRPGGSFIFYLQEMWREHKQRFWQYRVLNLAWPRCLCNVYIDPHVGFMLRSLPPTPLSSLTPSISAIVLEIILSSSSPAGSPSSPK